MDTSKMQDLLTILEEHRDNGVVFDLGRWFGRDKVNGTDACKTVGCACGLYVIARPHSELKLAFRKDAWPIVNLERSVYSGADLEKIPSECVNNCALYFMDKDGKIHEHVEAAAAYFGLTAATATLLFDPSRYAEDINTSITEVIYRVRHVLGYGVTQFERAFAAFLSDDDDDDDDDDEDSVLEDEDDWSDPEDEDEDDDDWSDLEDEDEDSVLEDDDDASELENDDD